MDPPSDSENEDEQPVEMLVAGRAKRSTAGNRMSTMIGEIAADDDLELLFAEDEEAGPDEEFEEDVDEGGSDNDLGDSSDDEDQGPAAGADDMEGEKEIERQAKEERKRKRKAQREFTRASKKVKHAPFVGRAAPSTPAAKAKKKAERLSWAPTTNDATRTSKRETTTQQSEALRTRIVAREKERKEQMKRLEEKARRREANKPRKLTQEDRLREAAEVEKENSKSLNRWEAIERERQEEQRLRLEALQNRKLQGPVISYWSGPARWVGDKLIAVGSEKMKLVEEMETASKEALPPDEDTVQTLQNEAPQDDQDLGSPTNKQPSGSLAAEGANGDIVTSLVKDQQTPTIEIQLRPKSSGSTTASVQVTATTEEPSINPSASPQLPTRDPSQSQFLSPSPQPPAHEEPPRSEVPSISPQPIAQADEEGTATASPQPPSSEHADEQRSTEVTESSNQMEDQSREKVIKREPSSAPPTLLDVPKAQPAGGQQIVFSILPSRTTTKQPSVLSTSTSDSRSQAPTTATADQAQSTPLPPEPPRTPPKPITATRNLISIVNVDVSNPTSSTLPVELRGSVLIAGSKALKKSRVAKAPLPPVCPITGLPVKYRDPATGMGYANAYAYRQLKNIREGRVVWNELTGTFLSLSSRVAEGVPEGFAEAQCPRSKVDE